MKIDKDELVGWILFALCLITLADFVWDTHFSLKEIKKETQEIHEILNKNIKNMLL